MKDILFLCIKRMFGLTNGYRILGRIFCRFATMILMRSARKVGDHLRGRDGLTLCYNCRKLAILLRISLIEDLVVFFVKLWTMTFWISLE
jgi:hypothetical protein